MSASTGAESSCFGGVYDGRRVLVTGHTGFKGSWLALWLTELGARVAGLSLPPSTEPAHWSLLELHVDEEHAVDLRDPDEVASAVATYQPEVVFHLAAQPLVRRSYREPRVTFDTNVAGVVNLLEAVRDTPSVRAVVNATTDKVYRLDRGQHAYVEDDPLGGHDPYSTSKAISELVSASYRSSYAVPVATARAGNVIGGGDWSEDRLVPDIARSVARGEPVRLRNPHATRPWQHVLEPLSGYLRIGQVLLEGEVQPDAWNLGPSPDATLTVGDIVEQLREHWPFEVEIDPGEHPYEAPDLALDSARAARDLAWRPVWDARETLRRTAAWYASFAANGTISTRDDLAAYVDDARSLGLSWAS